MPRTKRQTTSSTPQQSTGLEDGDKRLRRTKDKFVLSYYETSQSDSKNQRGHEKQAHGYTQGLSSSTTAANELRLLIKQNEDKKVMLLQYPNLDSGQLYCDTFGNKPLEIRIKPKCGLVEVDVPINVHLNYDRERGLEYGDALRKSRMSETGSSFYGLSGGLRPDVGRPSKTGEDPSVPEGPSRERLLEHFDDANNKGHVMNKITLGGRIIPFREGDPIYMIATSDGEYCTWTKLDTMVMLRPQFSHLDAIHDQRKAGVRINSRGPGARGELDKDEPESKAEDVNMVVKDTENPESLDVYGGMHATMKLLRDMNDEPWQKLTWVDSEDSRAYDAYNSTLIYKDIHNAPQLTSELTNEQYLDTISCPRIDPIHQGRQIMITSKEAEVFSSDEEADDGGSHLDDDVMDQTDDGHDAIPFITGNKQEGGLAIEPNGTLSYYAAGTRHRKFISPTKIWTAIAKSSVSERVTSELGASTLRRSKDEDGWVKQQHGTVMYVKNSKGYNNFLQPALQHQIIPFDKDKATAALIGSMDKDGYALNDSKNVMYYRNGTVYHRVPHQRPKDRLTSVIVEEICRLICSQAPKDRSDCRSFCIRQKGKQPGYGFLNTGDALHGWFQWRLKEHEAGRGFEGSLSELGLWSSPVQ